MLPDRQKSLKRQIAEANEAAKPAIATFDAQVTKRLVEAGKIDWPKIELNTRTPVSLNNPNFIVELVTYHEGMTGLIACASSEDSRHLIVRRNFTVNPPDETTPVNQVNLVILHVSPLSGPDLTIEVDTITERASRNSPDVLCLTEDNSYGPDGVRRRPQGSASIPQGTTHTDLVEAGFQKADDLPGVIDHGATVTAIVEWIIADCQGPLPLVTPSQA